MNEKSLVKLEFHKIRALLEDNAVSDYAKSMCRNLEPTANLYEIKHRLAATDEAYRYLMAKSAPSFYGLKDIRGAVGRSTIDASLTMKELLDIAGLLEATERVKTYSQREASMTGAFPELDPRFEGLYPIPALESEIRRCILTENDMADDASPTLKHIRREITNSENKIQSVLQNMIHSEAYKTSLQDAIVTLRGGRYCLPVKSEYKSAVTGMIHDQSSSGSTLFIEPMAVVELNNNIQQLLLQEQEEILKILKELSGRVRANEPELMNNFNLLGELDFIFAKAKLAKQQRAVLPAFNQDGIIELKQARHPLLDPKKVVPIDIHLGDEFTTLVITGPNTGGKTVTLKTLGLLQLMGQAGLMIPAADGARLSIFDQIFADIGDEQSIEQSLSTFSSHMVNIVEILKEVTYESLVLFDELGAGTDPTEGAALAQSILEYLKGKGVLTAATTHYSELKVYALSTEGVENASCEFDVESLMPTYRLLIGVPGKSNAFAISRRLGLSEDIISHASGLLESNDIKFEDMLSDLEIKRFKLEEESEQAKTLLSETQADRLKAAEELQKAKAERDKAHEKAKEEAREIVRQAKAEADHIISRMNKLALKGGNSEVVKELEKERQGLKKSMDDLAPTPKEVKKEPFFDSELIPGTKVIVKGFEQEISLLSKPDARGNIKAQAGILKMNINKADILKVVREDAPVLTRSKGQRASKGAESAVLKGSMVKATTFKDEIDLRGMMTDEGVQVLDKYLDDAILLGIEKVRVIHGKGTGAMRKAVHQYLKRNRMVSEFRLGMYGEGDSGVTVVTLKKAK